MDILKVDNFSLAFKREKSWHTVLHNVTFALKKGETLGIVGESGSGKSVMALSIMKLLSATQSRVNEGNIHYFDTESSREISILPLKEKELRKIREENCYDFSRTYDLLEPVIKMWLSNS